MLILISDSECKGFKHSLKLLWRSIRILLMFINCANSHLNQEAIV